MQSGHEVGGQSLFPKRGKLWMVKQAEGQLLLQHRFVGWRDGDQSLLRGVHHELGFGDVFEVEEFEEAIEQSNSLGLRLVLEE